MLTLLIVKQAIEVSILLPSIFVADQGRFSGFRGRRGGRAGHGGGSCYGGRDNRFICQLCVKLGHVALKCFKRFDVHLTGVSSTPPHAYLSDVGAMEYGQEESYYDPTYDYN